MTVEVNLQTALYAKLKTDTALVALATGGIYDYVPNGTSEPYITMGTIDSEEWDTKTWDGQRCLLEVVTWSTSEGREECKTIMDRIYAVLHRKKVTVDGADTVTVRYLGSGVTLEVDGITHRGSSRYEILLQIN